MQLTRRSPTQQGSVSQAQVGLSTSRLLVQLIFESPLNFATTASILASGHWPTNLLIHVYRFLISPYHGQTKKSNIHLCQTRALWVLDGLRICSFRHPSLPQCTPATMAKILTSKTRTTVPGTIRGSLFFP